MKNKTFNTQKLIVTGMLAAIAGVLMSFEISVPMMPPFYKLDFSDVPSLIALFTLGPVPACAVEIIKILIKLFTVGTNSMYVGEFANLIGILLFVVPTWFVYKLCGKDKKAIIISLATSVIIRTACSCCINAFITLPLYAKAMGTTMNEVIAFVGSVNPKITNLPTFIILATIPFNIMKGAANCLVAFLVYSQISHTEEVRKVTAIK